MQMITSFQSALYLVIQRISIKQSRYVTPLVESVVNVTREANTIMNVASGISTRTNLMEGVIM